LLPGFWKAIRQPISYKHYILNLSGSMGVTVYPGDDSDADLLISPVRWETAPATSAPT